MDRTEARTRRRLFRARAGVERGEAAPRASGASRLRGWGATVPRPQPPAVLPAVGGGNGSGPPTSRRGSSPSGLGGGRAERRARIGAAHPGHLARRSGPGPALPWTPGGARASRGGPRAPAPRPLSPWSPVGLHPRRRVGVGVSLPPETLLPARGAWQLPERKQRGHPGLDPPRPSLHEPGPLGLTCFSGRAPGGQRQRWLLKPAGAGWKVRAGPPELRGGCTTRFGEREELRDSGDPASGATGPEQGHPASISPSLPLGITPAGARAPVQGLGNRRRGRWTSSVGSRRGRALGAGRELSPEVPEPTRSLPRCQPPFRAHREVPKAAHLASPCFPTHLSGKEHYVSRKHHRPQGGTSYKRGLHQGPAGWEGTGSRQKGVGQPR